MVTISSHVPAYLGGATSQVGQAARQTSSPAGGEVTQALSSMQNKALDALAREIPGMSSTQLRRLDPAEYTPEKVAGRISDLVASGLENARARGRSEEAIQKMYDSAVAGTKQGFDEAKDILKNLDLLKDNIAEQVKQTEQKTFDALSQLDPSAAASAATANMLMGAAERYQSAESFDLSLRTRDGDLVKISFAREQQYAGSFAYGEDGQGNVSAAMDVSRTEQSNYQFIVQGDLDEDELEALQNLVHSVGEVANDFYGGDVQSAFDKLSDVDFDSSQLASLNLRMARSEQFSAAQAYRQTQQVDAPEVSNAARRVGHLAQDAKDAVQRPELDFIEDRQRFANMLLEGLAKQDTRYLEAAPERQESLDERLAGLLRVLGGERQSI